jgi:hypothetical protein
VICCISAAKKTQKLARFSSKRSFRFRCRVPHRIITVFKLHRVRKRERECGGAIKRYRELPGVKIAHSVGIATGYRMDDRGVGVRVPLGPRIFSSPRCPDRLWGPPNLLSNGYRGALSPGVKRPGCEADHSLPTSAEVKEKWFYTATPHTLSCGVMLNSLSAGTSLPFFYRVSRITTLSRKCIRHPAKYTSNLPPNHQSPWLLLVWPISLSFFLICAVRLRVLRPLLAYSTNLGW